MAGSIGFEVLQHRWVVERTPGLAQSHPPSRQRLRGDNASAKAWVYFASILAPHLPLRRRFAHILCESEIKLCCSDITAVRLSERCLPIKV
jgi:hypothetical protein